MDKINKIKNSKIASSAGWVSIITNILLFILKYWAGVVTGSVAIIVDAWHTLSDSLSSVIVILSIRISRKPPDTDHPFGHGRADLIASLIIGFMLGVVAINFFIESAERLMNKDAVQFGRFALIVIIISILFKEFLAQYAFMASRKTGSKALRADGWHHRSDAISSVLVLIGIFLDDFFWWIDGVLGILISLLLVYAMFEILKDSISRILGEKPDNELVAKIREICQRCSGILLYPHHFHIHRYGDHSELTLHINLPKDLSLEQAHNIATEIEEAIREELDMETTIHMEPLSVSGER
ncbi:MAG: cation transporter [Bacteroidales bacterium]|nr:cation transporter [Bacteroidales bacterium]